MIATSPPILPFSTNSNSKISYPPPIALLQFQLSQPSTTYTPPPLPNNPTPPPLCVLQPQPPPTSVSQPSPPLIFNIPTPFHPRAHHQHSPLPFPRTVYHPPPTPHPLRTLPAPNSPIALQYFSNATSPRSPHLSSPPTPTLQHALALHPFLQQPPPFRTRIQKDLEPAARSQNDFGAQKNTRPKTGQISSCTRQMPLSHPLSASPCSFWESPKYILKKSNVHGNIKEKTTSLRNPELIVQPMRSDQNKIGSVVPGSAHVQTHSTSMLLVTDTRAAELTHRAVSKK
ncbi:uncharacterized protein LOC135215757 [Macrobrachium nipponense]|uniref:uncharacterized protein LOC135215757 n=1 Tax=Macrobrachium nipponense TaxID=159736 RepID=UPI0030C87A05